MNIKELTDTDILDFLMTSEFEDNYSPEELKYLLTKWRYFYRLSHGKYNRLKDEKAKVWINGGSKGFGKNREALKAWTDAQFDGAIATNILVKTNSNIDTSKPFKVLQSEPKEHDQAVLQHLKTQLKYAKGADKQHYEHEIDAFEHLGFHDTYAIGHDKKGRTTVFSISNKKGNYLEDMWNNSSPAAALNLIKNSFSFINTLFFYNIRIIVSKYFKVLICINHSCR